VEASIVLFFFVLLLGITSRLLVVSVLLLGIEIPEKVVLRVARGAHLSREEMNQKRYTKKGKADGNSSRTVVDLSKLRKSSLKRYKHHFKLEMKANPSKAEL